MIEATASRDICYPCLRRLAKQMLARSIEAEIANELVGRAAKEPAEMLLQRTGRHTTSGCQAAQRPGALRLGVETVERPVQIARKRSRGHGAAPTLEG